MAAIHSFEWHGEQFRRQLENEMETKLDVIAQGIVDLAKGSMIQGKHGRDIPRDAQGRRTRKQTVAFSAVDRKGNTRMVEFKASARGWVTRRSAPGEPPAVQTGRLLRSVTWEKSDRLTRRVGTNVEYGLYLEFGTKKMAARPWLRPALERIRPLAEQMLNKPMEIKGLPRG